MAYRIVFFLLLLKTFDGFAQTPKIDSLRKQVYAAANGKEKLAAIFALCKERSSFSPDTLYHYAVLAKGLAQKTDGRHDGWLADYYMANSLALKGKLDTALQLLDENYTAVQQNESDRQLQNYYSFLKGQLLIKSNRQREALEIYYAALARAEKNNDTMAQLVSCTCIGWTYMELDQNRTAIDWFYKAINGVQNPSLFDTYNLCFSNLAATYNAIGKNDSAEYFIKKSLYYARKQQSLQSIANSLAIEAGIFLDTRRNAEAEQAMNEVIRLRKQIGDPFYIVSDMMQLALFYAHNGQPQKGIALCNEGIRMANQFNLRSKLSILYEALAENYKAAGQYQQYGETLQKLMAVKDSAYTLASADALAGLQAKYDVQKKENIILQQHFDLERKNYFLYASLLLFLVALVAGIAVFTQYKRRQRLKMKFLQEEESRKAEKAVLWAEEAERKRIAADLHDSLGAYAASIASNIEQLQIDIGGKRELQELQSNAQAIVSQLSDTIWVLKKDAQLLTAISDRIKLFIQRIAPSYPQITIDVSEEIETDYLLPPAQAFHLFQIIKEGVNNSLKHSRCRQIMVRLESSTQWRISIGDDGSGLLQNTTLAQGGNGLHNMQTRAVAAGWKIEWKSNEPRGTKVIVEPTIN